MVVLLFGAKRLPDAARSLGKSMRIFKSEVKELQNDDKPDAHVTPDAGASPSGSPSPVAGTGDPPSPSHTDARPA